MFYLVPGFLLAVYSYNGDLRTFQCEDSGQPHGYITLSSQSYTNPDPAICHRRGFQFSSIASIPVLTAIGLPLIVIKGLENHSSADSRSD